MNRLSHAFRIIAASIFVAITSYAMAAPDEVWINGEVHTSNPLVPNAQAFAVENGKFLAVGTSDEIQALVGVETKVNDLAGKAVIPGIIDGHFHLSSWIYYGSGVNLADSTNISTWLERVKERAKITPKGEIIFGGGWGHSASGKLPSAKLLDEVAPDNPVLLVDLDHHTIWVNSKLMERYGITNETPNPPGGEIVKDAETGEPTGILKETAGFMILKPAVASLPKEKRDAIWQEAIAYVNSLGITGIHNMGLAHELSDLMALLEQDDLALRVWFGAIVNSADEVKENIPLYRSINSKSEQFLETGPRLQFGFFKTFADGVVSTRTAALKADYSDASGVRGRLILSRPVMAEIISTANDENIPVAVHAIGDEAIRATLEAFASSSSKPSLPNRVEHAELAAIGDLSRFASLDIVASMQPRHAVTGIDYYRNRVGDRRYESAFPWKKIKESGAQLMLSSDWPTERASPLILLHAATTRSDLNGKPQEGADQVLGFQDALFAMTQQAANVSGWGEDLGSIRAGKWADFVVLDQPIPKRIDKGLLDLSVAATFLAGEAIYRKDSN